MNCAPLLFRLALLPFALLVTVLSPAQYSKPVNYPDRKTPGRTAQVFAKGIISTEEIEHSSPAFSADGNTVLWTIMKMPSYQMRLLEMTFTNGKWSSPRTPSFSDTTANESYPDFSPGGDTLYFTSDRKIDGSSSVRNTVWYATKIADGWSEARVLDTNAFKKDIYPHSVSKSGTWYFTVGPHGTSDWNIYKKDVSGKVDSLSAVNSKGYEDGPFIAPDESYLIFESDREEGNIDLYITFRKKDDTWTKPVNLGPRVNSAHAERFARVSPDGRFLFFGRNTGNGFDIYWIQADVIDEIRQIGDRR